MWGRRSRDCFWLRRDRFKSSLFHFRWNPQGRRRDQMGDCLEFDINITVRQPQLACNDDVHGPPKRLRRARKLHSKHFGLLSSERETCEEKWNQREAEKAGAIRCSLQVNLTRLRHCLQKNIITRRNFFWHKEFKKKKPIADRTRPSSKIELVYRSSNVRRSLHYASLK